MGIDFHDRNLEGCYARREVHDSWRTLIKSLVPIERIGSAADIGCGGGIYSRVLAGMGIPEVTGGDFSEAMLIGAVEHSEGYENLSYHHGSAYSTGLKSDSQDLVLERALIHHVDDVEACFAEAFRVLQKGGTLIVQDRTREDCFQEGSTHHIRGYIMELFPKLREKEESHRPQSNQVIEALKSAGFNTIEEIVFWETRALYESKEPLLEDIRSRTGRSILFDLDDKELERLVGMLNEKISVNGPLEEKDRWTIWKAVKLNTPSKERFL
ncbi:methyltransferase domain-containing protein [Rossellomorea marisflavi]|uniref:class I SAM-dependent methyltransferase n=1 Tax=Rossellomorea marisflavi TaxID=189381 RepID=UPI00203CE70C|nr:class I SAM-dependent methyltransferase [Rossellomorea marisflavi]MCM2605181.1 methyltransferase domain-containing protein [Rossellomorea marisflavi]